VLAFMSNMVVLPEAGLGVFVSTNTDTGGELSSALPRMIFERLLPDARPAPVPPPPADFGTTAKRFEGSYGSQRRAYTTLEKLVTLAQPTTVSVAKDGLAISAGEKTTLWVPEGPLLFRSRDTGARIEFLEGPAGQIVGFASASSVSDRIGALDSAKVLGMALGALALICVGALLGAWRRHGRAPGAYSRQARWGALIVGVASVTWLSSLLLLLVALSALSADPFVALPSYPDPALRASVGLAYAGSLLAVGGVALLVAGWRGSGWPWGRTLRHALVLVAMLGAAALLTHWNILFAPYALGA
jgi:hypothetical protein